MNVRTILLGAATSTFLLGAPISSALAADSTVVVTSADMAASFGDLVQSPNSWFFYNDENDTIDNALGSFVVGPGTPFNGVGSAQISVSGSQRRNLATYQFRGIKLADITSLQFSTYNPSAGNGGSVSRTGYLQFNVDFDGTDTWQKRLLFEPTANGTVQQDTWQEWDAYNGGNARWTWSGLSSHGGSASAWPDGNTNEFRTWNELVSAFPNIAIRQTDSWLGIRVGSPYPSGYTENLDSLVFGTAGGTTTFDFEPGAAACKHGGWMTNPQFRNQGECVSYVNRNPHAKAGH